MESNAPQGESGAAGINGNTPQLKFDDNAFLCVFYDNGATWTSLGVKALAFTSVIDIDNNLRLSLLDDYTYTVDGFYKEDGCKVLNIPAAYNGIPITQISREAFMNCTSITEINLSSKIKKIEIQEFSECTGIENLIIPEGVDFINSNAFYGCTGLKSIEILDTVTILGPSVFQRCSNLSSVKLGANLKRIELYAFSSTALTNVTIPNNVEYLGQDAFSWCKSLESITLPKSITAFGMCVFANSSKLSTINYCGSKAEWENISKQNYW